MKKLLNKTVAIIVVVLLCLVMVSCRPRQGTCNTPGCDNMQVIISNNVEDYCFNCLQEQRNSYNE